MASVPAIELGGPTSAPTIAELRDGPRSGRAHAPFALALGVVWVLQYHRALHWLLRSWNDATYESWGFLPLLLVILWWRGARADRPRWRRTLALPPLLGVATLALLDLLCAPLAVNGLSALLALLALYLGLASLLDFRQRGWSLLVLLALSLPVVFWTDVLAGHHLQRLATLLAARTLGLYGVHLDVSGTVLSTGTVHFAVDSACSGLRMLYSGLLLGLFMQPAGWRRPLFWGGLALALLGANVVRVVALALAHLHRGVAPSETMHEAIGLVAFTLALAPLVLWSHFATRRRHS